MACACSTRAPRRAERPRQAVRRKDRARDVRGRRCTRDARVDLLRTVAASGATSIRIVHPDWSVLPFACLRPWSWSMHRVLPWYNPSDPDIRWNARKTTLGLLARAQLSMLLNAATLSASMTAIYSTCSSEPEENERSSPHSSSATPIPAARSARIAVAQGGPLAAVLDSDIAADATGSPPSGAFYGPSCDRVNEPARINDASQPRPGAPAGSSPSPRASSTPISSLPSPRCGLRCACTRCRFATSGT